MKNRYIKIILSVSILLTITVNSCTDLSETLYSSISASNFYNTKTELLSAMFRSYTQMNSCASFAGFGGNYWATNELTADQLAWPQKGINGYDQGKWIRLHYHTWTKEEADNVYGPWKGLYTGVGYVNSLLGDFDSGLIDFAGIGVNDDEKRSLIAELKVIRAWNYMALMDLYGNIPVVTTVGEPLSPPTKPRSEVFAFIEQELLENIDYLQPYSASMVGRATKSFGYAVLSALYLNAEVWTGTARWDDCIAACDKIINGETGKTFSISPNIMEPFGNSNESSDENIFQFSCDPAGGRFGGTPAYMVFNHYRNQDIYNSLVGGINGVVVQEPAYDAYKDNDLRKEGWFAIGPQYYYGTTTPVLGSYEYSGQPLVFVKEIQRNSEGKTLSNMTQGEENSGARFQKYRTGQKTDKNYNKNDYVVYRIAEIYFNKAEALMRKNNNVATQEAVDLINSVKERAFSAADWVNEEYTASTLTIDELLAERGREFIFEGKRRTDLIRFGVFTTASWWDHEPTEAYRNLMPIPQTAIVNNMNLIQNEGYK
jgi:hypothetical protein